jgi:hypothetical protein
LTTGEAPTNDFVAEECSCPEEAERLAVHYHGIIARLMAQMNEQDR